MNQGLVFFTNEKYEKVKKKREGQRDGCNHLNGIITEWDFLLKTVKPPLILYYLEKNGLSATYYLGTVVGLRGSLCPGLLLERAQCLPCTRSKSVLNHGGNVCNETKKVLI